MKRICFALLSLTACSERPVREPSEPRPRITVHEDAILAALTLSDDFDQHADVMMAVTTELVETGKCSLTELKDMGGWTRSATGAQAKGTYFTYCGGFTAKYRLYLNINTGAVWQR